MVAKTAVTFWAPDRIEATKGNSPIGANKVPKLAPNDPIFDEIQLPISPKPVKIFSQVIPAKIPLKLSLMPAIF